MTQELIVRQAEVGIFLSPQTVLENARAAAAALADVISKKKKPVILNGEQYLEFEDWQTCGQFYGYTVKTGDAVLVEVDGIKGAKAHADLIDIKTGMYLGGAEAFCMRDEEHWNTRPKYEWQGEGDNRKRVKVGEEIVPWFQLASMAQTRAGAKALRNRLAWVVVLAGYKATPPEEMNEDTVSPAVKERRTVDKSQHWCEVHQINFFKKGKMKAYAHPIGETGEWCHEHKHEEPEKEKLASESKLEPEPKYSPVTTDMPHAAVEQAFTPPDADRTADFEPENGGSSPPSASETELDFDKDWLLDSLKQVHWKDNTVKSYLKNVYKVDTEGTVVEVVVRLTRDQREAFFKEISDRLQMV